VRVANSASIFIGRDLRLLDGSFHSQSSPATPDTPVGKIQDQTRVGWNTDDGRCSLSSSGKNWFHYYIGHCPRYLSNCIINDTCYMLVHGYRYSPFSTSADIIRPLLDVLLHEPHHALVIVPQSFSDLCIGCVTSCRDQTNAHKLCWRDAGQARRS
jgi:hypothetical protein